MRRSTTLAALIALASMLPLTSCGSSASSGAPPVPVDLQGAVAAGQQEGRVVLAYFTADWCPPCQQMKKDTWPDPRVAKWLTDNANFHTIDLDANREMAQSLGIRGIPTIVAYKDGREADRIVGYRGPADMLAWLEPLARR